MNSLFSLVETALTVNGCVWYSGCVRVFRNKWLKDTGIMFPSHASMVWAPVDDRDEKARRDNDYNE